MRFAIIENGAVKNVVVSDPEFASEQGWIPAGEAVTGDLYDPDSGQFTTPPPVIVVPESVTMAQARKSLILGGISIASIDAAIAAMPDMVARELAQTDWDYSANVRRDSPLVLSLSSVLGLSTSQLDALFVAAGKL